jgi:hypothetical protein
MPEPDLEVIDPTELTTTLSAVAFRIRSLIIRELTENESKYMEVLKPEAKAGPAVAAMEALVENINTGKDISGQLGQIGRLIHNQDSRAEVFNSLALTHSYGRYVHFLKAIDRIEQVMLAMANEAQLTPGDALALLEYMQEETKKIESKISSNTASNRDIAALLGKVDFAVSSQQQELAKRMAKTTPQNREIIRRVAHRLLKSASEKRGQ